jgi:undecaprenyl-phosphate 4-deoxy-4-formamido-L-arabinose transferase
LLGEYIGRIYHDVRARPRFFVQEVVGRSEIGGGGGDAADGSKR